MSFSLNPDMPARLSTGDVIQSNALDIYKEMHVKISFTDPEVDDSDDLATYNRFRCISLCNLCPRTFDADHPEINFHFYSRNTCFWKCSAATVVPIRRSIFKKLSIPTNLSVL